MQRLILSSASLAARRIGQAAVRGFFTARVGSRPSFVTPRVHTPARFIGDNMGGQAMSVDECVEINQKTLQDLRAMEVPLSNMKVTPAPVAVRWNQVMLALMLSRLNAIKVRNPGMSDQEAYVTLQKLSISSRKHLATSAPLRDIEQQTWEFLLRVAFGRSLPDELPLTLVRKIALDLCVAVSEKSFQEQLRGACHGKDINTKNQVLVTSLMSAQMEIFKTHGFVGEDGYICVQKGLVDCAGDTVVLAFTSAYNTILLEVAEIDPAAAGLPKIG